MPFLISAVAGLGAAVSVAFGFYHPTALALMGISLVLCLLGNVYFRIRAERLMVPLFGTYLALFFWLLRAAPFKKVEHGGWHTYVPFIVGLGVAALFIAAGLLGARPWWFAGAVAVHFLLGVWVLRMAPSPDVDVWTAHMDGAEALVHGKNPYEIRFRAIQGQNPNAYGPGNIENGRAKFGYPYPPVTLLLSMPGYLLFGDTRYSQLFALAGAGLLLGFGFPGKLPKMAACLYLFWPKQFLVLEQCWTEPFVVFLMACTVVAMVRRPGFAWLPLGLLLVSKQYMFAMVPLCWLLAPGMRGFTSLMLRAGAAAAIATLPLALWNFHEFWSSNITLQLIQPFRNDALSFAAAALRMGWSAPPSWAGFALLAAGMAYCLWRNPRTPAGFAGSVAVCLFLFIAFNKQAFTNYYDCIIGSICVAAAEALRLVSASPSSVYDRAALAGQGR